MTRTVFIEACHAKIYRTGDILQSPTRDYDAIVKAIEQLAGIEVKGGVLHVDGQPVQKTGN